MDVKRKGEFDRRIHKGYVIRVQTLDGGMGAQEIKAGSAWTGYYYPVSVRVPRYPEGPLGEKERTFVLGRAHYGCEVYDPSTTNLQKKYKHGEKPECKALHLEGFSYDGHKYREAEAGVRFVCPHGKTWDVTVHQRYALITAGNGGENEPPVFRWRKWLKKEHDRTHKPVFNWYEENVLKPARLAAEEAEKKKLELELKKSKEAAQALTIAGPSGYNSRSEQSVGFDPDAVTEYPSSNSAKASNSVQASNSAQATSAKPIKLESLRTRKEKSPSGSGSSKESGRVKLFRPSFWRKKSSQMTRATTVGATSSDSGLAKRLLGRAKKRRDSMKG
jgi:hypothetical protein